MKVEIIKKVNLVTKDGEFAIRLEGKPIAVRSFRLDVPENDLYNEQKNYKEALAIAKAAESETLETTEVVYKTGEE
jgi:hypothetical protein